MMRVDKMIREVSRIWVYLKISVEVIASYENLMIKVSSDEIEKSDGENVKQGVYREPLWREKDVLR